jgi:hypothetical protein
VGSLILLKAQEGQFQLVSAFIGCKLKYAGNAKNIQKVNKNVLVPAWHQSRVCWPDRR